MPPLPFSPVKFSGEIDRVKAPETRDKFPKPIPNPLKLIVTERYPDAPYRSTSNATT
jgi:hypothetical protein